jgi:cation:H+ antiporter
VPQSAVFMGHNASLILEIPVMMLVMSILTIPTLIRGKLTRRQGILLLAIYAVFCFIQFTM